MDELEVIYIVPPRALASMAEISHRPIVPAALFPTFCPWMKSSKVPLASMKEISHSVSCHPAKGLEYLSSSNRNTYLFCCTVAFAALLLFNPLTDFHCSFACAGCFKMDQDIYPNLMASLHETHLKRTKNLQLQKRQRQPLQPPQPRRRRAEAAKAA